MLTGIFAFIEALLVYYFVIVNQYSILWMGASLAIYQIGRTGASMWYLNNIFKEEWLEA